MNKIHTFLQKLQHKTIHIIGISGAEGSTIASFLLQHNVKNIIGHDFVDKKHAKEQFFKFHDWMTDGEKEETFQQLYTSSITFRYKETYLSGIQANDIFFVPQSWFRYTCNDALYRFFHKDLSCKKEYKKCIYSLTQLYLELFPGITLGVTGSNGKSTTTALIGSVLQTVFEKDKKRRLFWGGNDRKNKQPLFEMEKAVKDDVLLLEISNRQLSFQMEKSPKIAIITNIIPNHLDDHGTYEKYIAAKREIIRYQTEDDIAVLNFEDKESRESSPYTKGKVFYFSNQHPVKNGAYRKDNTIVFVQNGKEEEILHVQDIRIKGEHNIENVVAVVASCMALGLAKKDIREGIRNFKGLPYRLEYVDTVKGVHFYDDSAGCNPKNIAAAITSFTAPSLFIVGGYRKNPLADEFDEFAVLCHHEQVKKIVIIGQVQEHIYQSLKKHNVNEEKIYRAKNLQDAVSYSFSIAKKGDNIVLAPGCESFGEFTDYRERGERFKEEVRKLKMRSDLRKK